ncbi:Maf family protein [Sedimenticola thiotaurini]|uniref:7-methyl-GTP pyrophosphatase n=1 Tax=Sedimenticola thiotaurini TaxID=1543721 RepID=A0A0F7JXV8_9GAMM|nr:nucleoside triphosphate pyrophosphatase [Sedimenticola thiotaurini]AKH19615.1 septum formation inhibitor Maf [Sedimenticola thiotaurini]
MNRTPSALKTNHPAIVLASTSPFRRELLGKLGLAFDVGAPDVDEQRHPHETPEQLVRRLAEAKAKAVARQHPDALVIGSDQVACIDEQILGKPGNRDRAIEQLSLASGKRVTFYTGLCLYNNRTDQARTSCELFHVHFRDLDKQQIERYLDREQPYNCAGSFKSEGLGIALFRRLEGDDPNTLIGLPLIRLISFLEAEGVQVP